MPTIAERISNEEIQTIGAFILCKCLTWSDNMSLNIKDVSIWIGLEHNTYSKFQFLRIIISSHFLISRERKRMLPLGWHDSYWFRICKRRYSREILINMLLSALTYSQVVCSWVHFAALQVRWWSLDSNLLLRGLSLSILHRYSFHYFLFSPIVFVKTPPSSWLRLRREVWGEHVKGKCWFCDNKLTILVDRCLPFIYD